MRLRMLIAAGWMVCCLAAVGGWAQSPAAPAAAAKPGTTAAPKQPAKAESTAADKEGERKFQQNCSRCHNAPQDLSPRATGTVLLHMRVRASLSADDELIMVACRGLLTDGALIGRAGFVTGSWLKYVYTEDLLRIRSGASDIPNAYLFAFMRSEVAFRMLRSLVSGTGPQDINAVLRKQIPVPECTPADRERIAKTVRQAYRWRDEADRLEERAQELLDAAVRGATGADLRQDSHLTHRPREADGTDDG